MQAEHMEKLPMGNVSARGPYASLLARTDMLVTDHSECHRRLRR